MLGLPLETARAILAEEGFLVEAVEARSKKGVDGDSLRVVRQLADTTAEKPTVKLVYCEFKTNTDGDSKRNN